MEIAKSGGVMLFIIDRIVSRTRERKWIKRKWVEKKTLEDLFDELDQKGVRNIYTHVDFDEPWPTFDGDLSWFAEIGWIEIESFIVQVTPKETGTNIGLEERVFICLTEKGRKAIEGSALYFPDHQKIIEEVISGIALNKN